MEGKGKERKALLVLILTPHETAVPQGSLVANTH